MTGDVISFFNCAAALREGKMLSAKPGCAGVEDEIITVKESASSVYSYVEQAALRLSRVITVTANAVCRAVNSRVRTFVRSVFRPSGVQMLHRFAILRI